MVAFSSNQYIIGRAIFPFMALPTDVRFMIYKTVFLLDEPLKWLPGPRCSRYGVFKLRLISKAIFQETNDFFFRNTFVANDILWSMTGAFGHFGTNIRSLQFRWGTQPTGVDKTWLEEISKFQQYVSPATPSIHVFFVH